MHIAQLKRIYYLDVPAAYSRLNDVFPPLIVKPFGHFFADPFLQGFYNQIVKRQAFFNRGDL